MSVHRSVYLLLTFTVVVLLAFACVQSSIAQKSDAANIPLVSLTAAQATHFSAALAAITAQTHVAVIAEGEPFRPVLPERNAPSLATPLPVSKAIEKVAAAYDYNVQRQDNVFILTKRYSDPEDLPNITVQEAVDAISDIARVTAQFNPNVLPPQYGKPDPLVGDVAASLTAEQLHAMRETTPELGLSIGSLNVFQQALVKRIALYYYVQDAEFGMSNVLYETKHMSQTAFCWRTLGKILDEFCFSFPSDSGELTYEPLSPPRPIAVTSSMIFPRPVVITSPRSGNPSVARKNPFSDPTEPPAKSPLLGTEPAPPPVFTLGQLIEDLPVQDTDKTRFTVEKALRDKVLCAFGQDSVPSASLVKAVVTLYGLRLRTAEDGHQELCRPLFRVPLEIPAIPDAILHVLPSSYVRALHLDEQKQLLSQIKTDQDTRDSENLQWAAQQSASQPKTDKTEAVPATPTTKPLTAEQMSAEWQARWQQEQDWSNRAETLATRPAIYRNEGVQQLRMVLDPILMADTHASTPLSTLGPREQQAFANVLMGDCMKGMRRLVSDPVPAFITHFDQVYLTGGPYQDESGKRKFSLFLSMPSPDGSRLEQQVGRGNVNFNGP